MTTHIHRSLLVLLVALLGGTQVAEAQGILGRARRAAERGAQRAVERQAEARARQATEAAINAMFDAGEDVVRCVFTDTECIEEAQSSGENVVLVDDEGNPVDRSGNPVDQQNAEAAVIRPGSPASGTVGAADANYDFQPGERVLFAEDFSNDNVGDFPRSLYYLSGTAEVVDFQGQRFLRSMSGGSFEIRLPQQLPGTFTLEFDAQVANGAGLNVYFSERVRDDDTRPFYGYEGDYLNVGNWRGSGLWSSNEPKSTVALPRDEVIPIRITVDDAYVKMYAGTTRIANVPRADLGRHNAVTFTLNSRNDRLLYIGDIRLGAGGNDLYGALESEGRVEAEGILFDTGSATLKPESFAVIQEVAAMLQEHGDLRILIEGHTDAEGDAASNQTLSVERANAVRTMLVGLGIDAGRLEATGFGQTRPVADNDTPTGREQNRRVELVRL